MGTETSEKDITVTRYQRSEEGGAARLIPISEINDSQRKNHDRRSKF